MFGAGCPEALQNSLNACPSIRITLAGDTMINGGSRAIEQGQFHADWQLVSNTTFLTILTRHEETNGLCFSYSSSIVRYASEILFSRLIQLYLKFPRAASPLY